MSTVRDGQCVATQGRDNSALIWYDLFSGVCPPMSLLDCRRAFVVSGARKAGSVIEALVMFLIYLVVIVVVCALVLWAVGRFFPEVATPARYVVGAIALIVILLALLRVIQGGAPALP